MNAAAGWIPGSAGVPPAAGRSPAVFQTGGTPALPGTPRGKRGSTARTTVPRQVRTRTSAQSRVHTSTWSAASRGDRCSRTCPRDAPLRRRGAPRRRRTATGRTRRPKRPGRGCEARAAASRARARAGHRGRGRRAREGPVARHSGARRCWNASAPGNWRVAALWGFGRVLTREAPQLQARMLDLDPEAAEVASGPRRRVLPDELPR